MPVHTLVSVELIHDRAVNYAVQQNAFYHALLASAAPDRLTHHAMFTAITGEIYRQRQREKEPPTPESS